MKIREEEPAVSRYSEPSASRFCSARKNFNPGEHDAGEFTPFRDAHYRSDVGLPLKSARARTQIMRYCLKTPLAFIETLTQTSTKHYLAHTHKFSSLLTFFLLLLSLSLFVRSREFF